MCGICGIHHFNDDRDIDAHTLESMTRSIIHRGPDDQGTYAAVSIGLGFRRLSIIDLDGGHQPMCDAGENIWVVFNGEIYNYRQLRQELEKYGHRFRTHSDTEVIVNGYLQWGIDVLEHLNGMFGLAVWDVQKRRLMLARDRVGIKFVYYKIEGDCILFASEIRSILAASSSKPDIDPVALNMFLRYRYTPSPMTMFAGIKKLPSGSRVIVQDGDLREEMWWKYKPIPFQNMPSYKQAEEELLHLYEQAVERQLASDVPLGLLLSGGLDSGLLLALMNKYGSNWKTFTVGYGKSFKEDELEYASRTAELLHAENISIKLDQQEFETSLHEIIKAIEEPVASSSIVPMYHMSQCAREHVKVVLMGQGPDELFGGYRRHLGVQYGKYWRMLPNWMTGCFKKTLNALHRAETVKRGLYSLDVQDRLKRYQHVFSILPGDTIDQIFQDGLVPADAGEKIFDCWQNYIPLVGSTDELGGLQFFEIRSSLPDELLMYADKLSMAHSLEVRVPFLDHDIVEYVERLDSSFKIRAGVRKRLHRGLCQRYLPKEIMRRKKTGFAVNVVDQWFRDSFEGKMNETLLNRESLMYSYLRYDKVAEFVDAHQSGRHDYHKILFSLIVFEEWMRINFG